MVTQVTRTISYLRRSCIYFYLVRIEQYRVEFKQTDRLTEYFHIPVECCHCIVKYGNISVQRIVCVHGAWKYMNTIKCSSMDIIVFELQSKVIFIIITVFNKPIFYVFHVTMLPSPCPMFLLGLRIWSFMRRLKYSDSAVKFYHCSMRIYNVKVEQ